MVAGDAEGSLTVPQGSRGRKIDGYHEVHEGRIGKSFRQMQLGDCFLVGYGVHRIYSMRRARSGRSAKKTVAQASRLWIQEYKAVMRQKELESPSTFVANLQSEITKIPT